MKSSALYPYHTRVSNFAQNKPRVGVFVSYGGGKTYLSLKWLEDIYKDRCQNHQAAASPFPALVLTLKTVIPQWGYEIALHSDFSYSLVKGTIIQRLKALKPGADIYVTSYDFLRSSAMLKAFSMTHTQERAHDGKVRHFFKGPRDTWFGSVIVDESTHLKELRTQRFKSLRVPCQYIPYRAILTGKPILERPEELFAQMLFLDDGATFGKSFWKFRNTYFLPGPPWDPYAWELKPYAEQKIAAKLNHLCIRISEEEVQEDLPPKRYIQIKFTLPKSLRVMYNKLKEEFYADLPGGEQYITKWATGRSQKMHQLCQGIFYTADGGYNLLHTMKLDWLRENVPLMLKEGPILIWTHLIRMIPLIAAVLKPIPLCIYKGEGMNDNTREAAKLAFQHGKVDVLILSQRIGYAGLNLQRAKNAIFTSTDSAAGLRDNAEKRNLRIGSEIYDKITYYDLVVEDSMDGVVLNAIKEKLDMAKEILKHVRKE